MSRRRPRLSLRAGLLRRAVSLTVATLFGAGIAMAAIPAAPALAADAGFESQFVADINAARGAHGLAPYSVAWDLVSVARQHSDAMAASQRLYHNPSLTTQITNWQSVGENVGVGPTVSAINTAFLNSPEHLANILDHGFTQVGVGVTVDSSGTIWVTEDFRQPMGVTAPAPTAPAPTAPVATAPAPVGTRTAAPVAAPSQPARSVPVLVRPAVRPSPAARLASRFAWLRAHARQAPPTDPLAQAISYARAVTTLAGK